MHLKRDQEAIIWAMIKELSTNDSQMLTFFSDSDFLNIKVLFLQNKYLCIVLFNLSLYDSNPRQFFDT